MPNRVIEELAVRVDSMEAKDAWAALVEEAARAGAKPASSGNDASDAGPPADDAPRWQGTGMMTAPEGEAGKTEDSWRDLYRVLMGSLRRSSAHFHALSLETLALGWAGLSRAHNGVWDEVDGDPWDWSKRESIQELIHLSRWAGAFVSGSTKAAVAQRLDVQEEDIAVFEPARPLCPAYLIAADWTAPRIIIAVRGTSNWADTMTDLVAHTEPFMGGHVHSGMLAAARGIVDKNVTVLETLLRQYGGYQILCVGHSLGGGVAALVAALLRLEHRERLAAVLCKGVSALGFGSPPVVTRELAEQCAPFIRTVVHNHDIVPRTCVASLAELQRELEGHRDAFFSRHRVAGFLRDSGAIAATKVIAKGLANAAFAGGAARMAARSPLGALVVAVGGLAAAKIRQMHIDAVGDDNTPSGIGGTTTPKAATNGAGAGGSSSGAPSKAPSEAGGPGGDESSSAAGDAADESAAQRRALEEKEAVAREAAMKEGGGRFQMEENEARIMLYSPGTILFLKRVGMGDNVRHTLVMAPPSGPRVGRIIVNRAMLRDHLLSSITNGLQRLLADLRASHLATIATAEAYAAAEAAAAEAAAAGAEGEDKGVDTADALGAAKAAAAEAAAAVVAGKEETVVKEGAVIEAEAAAAKEAAEEDEAQAAAEGLAAAEAAAAQAESAVAAIEKRLAAAAETALEPAAAESAAAAVAAAASEADAFAAAAAAAAAEEAFGAPPRPADTAAGDEAAAAAAAAAIAAAVQASGAGGSNGDGDKPVKASGKRKLALPGCRRSAH